MQYGESTCLPPVVADLVTQLDTYNVCGLSLLVNYQLCSKRFLSLQSGLIPLLSKQTFDVLWSEVS